jgi:mono/diheme cytochrome c family protein
MPEDDRGIRKVIQTMRRTKWLLFLAALALAAASCGYSDVSSDATAAPSGGGEDVGGAAIGQELFKSTCTACHGQNAEGIDGLGTDMHDNEFIQSLSNAELILFIAAGRSTTDPDNTTGVNMPPKGNNSSLTDTDLADIVDYLRTLQ